MDPVPELPKEIPAEIEMAKISEKMQELGHSKPEGAATGSVEDILNAAKTASSEASDKSSPVVIIIVGMAGSGKTTLTQRLTAELISKGTPPYIVNLDPACRDPPYPVNIDIRDVVKYKKVMEFYNLGPNGAIVTSLNLFATKFNEVLSLIEEKRKTHKYVIIDTPGQIEVFMWSASGNIITESLAALFPTVMIYVTDLIANINPITFISNMTYALSILYKTKLPLVVTFNKCDEVDPTYAKEWMTDYSAITAALASREDYSANLGSSLALALEEFYSLIEYTVVSAVDGYGMDDFFKAVQKSVVEYETVYRPMYEQMMKNRDKQVRKKQQQKLKQLKKDIKSGVAANEEEEVCFVRSGRDAGAGLTLRLDDAEDEDDTSSEDEEDAPAASEVNEEASFGKFFNQESDKRKEKEKSEQQSSTTTTAGSSQSKQKS